MFKPVLAGFIGKEARIKEVGIWGVD